MNDWDLLTYIFDGYGLKKIPKDLHLFRAHYHPIKHSFFDKSHPSGHDRVHIGMHVSVTSLPPLCLTREGTTTLYGRYLISPKYRSTILILPQCFLIVDTSSSSSSLKILAPNLGHFNDSTSQTMVHIFPSHQSMTNYGSGTSSFPGSLSDSPNSMTRYFILYHPSV
jgi:hypothetical protein